MRFLALVLFIAPAKVQQKSRLATHSASFIDKISKTGQIKRKMCALFPNNPHTVNLKNLIL